METHPALGLSGGLWGVTSEPTTELTIALNGVAVETRARTLADLCAERALAEQAIATAVNGTFVPRGNRQAWVLAPGDRVEILSPRQGG